MKAVRYHEHGGPSVLTLEEAPRPEPGAGKVLVDVRAASVNPIDTYVREGTASPAGGLPHIGGSDLAGVVESVGDGVTDFEAGDRVFATGLGVTTSGTYAEYATAPADVLAPLPDEVSFLEGAGGAMAFSTAWRALVVRGNLLVDDVCVVHGASGGVGHAAVQIAVHAGCRVVGTARDGEPAAFVESLGAKAVDYRNEALADAIDAATGGRGVDVVLESHADANIAADLTTLARGGRIVFIGEDGPVEIDPAVAMQGKLADADLRFMSIVASPADQAPILRRIGPLLADGTFSVRVDETYDLSAVAAAHERLLSPGVLGKLVIDIGR